VVELVGVAWLVLVVLGFWVAGVVDEVDEGAGDEGGLLGTEVVETGPAGPAGPGGDAKV
jgi:hypothetical protein